MEFFKKNEKNKVEKIKNYKEEYIDELKDEWWHADEYDEVTPIECKQVG